MLSKSKTFNTITFRDGAYRFNKEFDYNKITVVNGKSINLPDKLFTNFLSHNGGDKDEKKALKEINKQIKNNAFDYNKFDRRELKDNKAITDRVLEIINSYNTIKVNSITQIFKMRYEKLKNVQLYLYILGKELKVVLFDVHHLGLPADYGQIKSNPERIYKTHKNKRYCISKIIRT